ncbi:MAG: SDR family NAD(P)-dependent oxidoreductase [Rectinemataceae bacterium]
MSNRTTGTEGPGHGRFADRYGAWALVAGASEGLGAAFARALAARGMNLVPVARRKALLDGLAEDLRARFGVEVRPVAGDLAAPDFPERLAGSIADLDLGLVVYNAACAPVGDFSDADMSELMRVVDVNVRAPVALMRMLIPPMVERGRGAVVLMSSLAGNQGGPRLAAYAASKAFNRVLAEGLWHELRGRGIDAIACCAGAVRTPGYASASGSEAPGTLDPEVVAQRALRALGRGPLAIPGFVNLAADFFMSRLLPRRTAIGIMALSTKNLSRDGGKK